MHVTRWALTSPNYHNIIRIIYYQQVIVVKIIILAYPGEKAWRNLASCAVSWRDLVKSHIAC